MNLLQMICCAFVMKGSELSQQYLNRNYDVVQGNTRLRQRLLQIATTHTNQLLNAAIKESEATGTSLCNCEEIELPAETTPIGR
jgi:23S rRNA A1618 N6-methylase RlmF